MIDTFFPQGFFTKNEPMSAHTTFKIGGPAEYYYEAKTSDEIVRIVSVCKKNNLPVFIFGGGSNILVSDRGIKGIVVSNKTANVTITDSIYVEADSGVMLNTLIQLCAEKSLSGLENFAGIPGSVGGSLWINSHFLKFFIGDHVDHALVIDENGEKITLSQKDFHFGYEESILKEREWCLLSATFKLAKGNKDQIEQRMRDILKLRSEKHPLNFPSAGSVFRNPPNIPAGKLIEDAGLKGQCIGGAQVSEKHANFIINRDHAKAQDVAELIRHCQKQVTDKFGIKLEPEVHFVGEW